MQTFDETIMLYDIPAEKVDAFAKKIESAKFIPTGNWEYISSHQIKKFWVKTFDEIDNFILSLPENEQEVIKREIKRRKAEGLQVNLKTTQNFYDRAIKDRTA